MEKGTTKIQIKSLVYGLWFQTLYCHITSPKPTTCYTLESLKTPERHMSTVAYVFVHFRLLLWLHQKNHTRSPIKRLFYLVIYIILYKLARFSNHFASSITAPFPSRSSRYSSTSALSTGRLPGILRTEYPTLVFINFRYAEKTNFMQRDLRYSMQCVVGKFPSLGKENLK